MVLNKLHHPSLRGHIFKNKQKEMTYLYSLKASGSRSINASCLYARFVSKQVEQILETRSFPERTDTRLVAYRSIIVELSL
jgi:hypothetical protein